MQSAYDVKTTTDAYYSPEKIDELMAVCEEAIEAAAATGNYSVVVSIESIPSIVVEKTIPQIRELGYKVTPATRQLKIDWSKAIEIE